MNVFVALARPLLILIFLAAGAAKLPHPAGLRRTLAELGLPPPVQAPVAAGLSLGEIAVAGLLAWPGTAVAGAALACLFCLLFIGAVVLALATRRVVPCSCFGNIVRGVLSKATLVRDLALLALCISTLGVFLARPGLRRWLSPLPWPYLKMPTALVLALSGVILLAAAYTGWLVTSLVRQNARLLGGPAADPPTGSRDSTAVTLIGSPAPALEVIGADPPDPSPVLTGVRTLLVFLDEACVTCVDLASEIVSWQRALASAGNRIARSTQILAVVNSRGSARGGVADGLAPIVHDIEGQVTGRYGITATPVAMIIDEQQRIASRKAFGPEEIRHLHFHFLDSVVRRDEPEPESQPWTSSISMT